MDAGRNIVPTPGLNVWDTGIGKNIRFHERFKVQFRAEFFNFFNHANFNSPQRTVNVTAPRFGVINSADRPREMQFGVKVEF